MGSEVSLRHSLRFLLPTCVGLTLSCQQQPPYAELPEGEQDTDEAQDTGASGGGWTEGDPLQTIGWGALDVDPEEVTLEWLAAEVLEGERYGVAVGAPGLAVVDLQEPATGPGTGTTGIVAWEPELRGFLLARDGDVVHVGTRWAGVMSVDLSHPLAPLLVAEATPATGYHEDIAADGGLVLVAAQEEGALILDGTDLSTLAVIPASHAAAVGIEGDRALVVDGTELALYDLSDPEDPVLLDLMELSAEGRDLAVDGDRVAVAMGGRGMLVADRSGDVLVERARLAAPGSVLSVDLAEDYLWFGAWETVGVAWVGEGEPVVLGHELPFQSGLAIAGGSSRALVADWNVTTVLALEPGLRGAELHLPEQIYVARDSTEAWPLSVTNHGALPLILSIDPGDSGWSVEPAELELAPSEGQVVLLSPPEGGVTNEETLQWTSNDPDEPAGSVVLKPADSTVGSVHPEVTLPGFDWPDTTLQTYALSEHAGEVVFLAYFASW